MNGLIAYEGKSRIDGAPIVVILTALNGSMNTKTGHMVQSYILRADIDPVKAARLGLDASICGDCQHRPTNARRTGNPPCYVNIGRSALGVWKAYKRGSYPRIDTDTAAALRANEMNAEAILKATKVDGVYTADPKKDPEAKRYAAITFDEAISRNLQVMDGAAFALCRDQKLPIKVFSIFKPGALKRVVSGEDEGTLVHV